MTYDMEHLLTCLFAICISSLVRYLLRSLAHFQLSCLFSYYWVLRVLYLFWITILYQMCLLKMFSYLWLVFSSSWHCVSQSRSFYFFFFNIYLFIYLWLCWVFISVWGLSLVAASGGHSSSQCAGLSLSRPLLLWSTGSRRAGSAIVAHGPSRSTACGIFPDQGSNPCPLHWQADSQPLHHQGSPEVFNFNEVQLIDYFFHGSCLWCYT